MTVEEEIDSLLTECLERYWRLHLPDDSIVVAYADTVAIGPDKSLVLTTVGETREDIQVTRFAPGEWRRIVRMSASAHNPFKSEG